MNAAIARRLTGSAGQYSVVEVQPSVTARLRSQSTFGQNPLAPSTSVNPEHSASKVGEAAIPASAIAARTCVAQPHHSDPMALTTWTCSWHRQKPIVLFWNPPRATMMANW